MANKTKTELEMDLAAALSREEMLKHFQDALVKELLAKLVALKKARAELRKLRKEMKCTRSAG